MMPMLEKHLLHCNRLQWFGMTCFTCFTCFFFASFAILYYSFAFSFASFVFLFVLPGSLAHVSNATGGTPAVAQQASAACVMWHRLAAGKQRCGDINLGDDDDDDCSYYYLIIVTILLFSYYFLMFRRCKKNYMTSSLRNCNKSVRPYAWEVRDLDW